jgi:hypothetical protein
MTAAQGMSMLTSMHRYSMSESSGSEGRTEGANPTKQANHFICSNCMDLWAGISATREALEDAVFGVAIPPSTKRLMIPPQKRKANALRS